jgi:hypothetical protein
MGLGRLRAFDVQPFGSKYTRNQMVAQVSFSIFLPGSVSFFSLLT